MLRIVSNFSLILILLFPLSTEIKEPLFEKDSRFLDHRQRSFKYPNIPMLTKSLREIVKNKKEHSQIFHVSEIFDSYFYLYWENQKAIYILQPKENESETNYADSIRFPTGGSRIEIDRNVVDTLEQVGSSTYLIHRDFLNSVLEKCRKGILIRI
ncbi:hypothetical protein [Leptospira stimsonii]|uniref:Uncharacterized protein n=1 Tax=Leptospira stimsonii TaxID=2202203 RepID=A0A396ZI52_9LEPT|nr:hypothetical protein [Leptospira stimsonii]RHX92850.1 hypothetical protein DLM75_06705 [Leptospira stimsonii]